MDIIFERTARHAKTLTNVSEKDMLKLYGLYKQANFGPCNISKPYFWDLTAKAKWESWKRLEKLSKDEAKLHYINHVKTLDPHFDEHIDNANSVTNQPIGLGLSVSTLKHEIEEELNDCDKTVFDWCKEGKLKKLHECLDSDKNLLNVCDNENRSLLHWAVDRNYFEIVEFLLTSKCEVNSQDEDGQTALHYAVTCEYDDLITLLLKYNADVSIRDNDNMLAMDMCNSKEIKALFL